MTVGKNHGVNDYYSLDHSFCLKLFSFKGYCDSKTTALDISLTVSVIFNVIFKVKSALNAEKCSTGYRWLASHQPKYFYPMA